MHSEYPNLSNAPIEEAIISLTIGRNKHASLEEVKAVCEKLKSTYPHQKPWALNEFALKMSDTGVDTSHQQKANGFVLSSDNQKKIIHLSCDTLSLNRLRPYGSWKDFSDDYKSAWDIFTESLKIEEITGLTIRYINSFTIPTLSWEEYLLMRPTLQSNSAYDTSIISMGEVFSRYVLISERHMAESMVSLTLRPENTDTLRVIMDIDVHSRTDISNYSGYHAVIDVLNRLRDFKNQIFFSNLPKATELFS